MPKPAPPEPPLQAGWKRDFRRRLLKWYEKHARELPWRESSDPYAVWVSEIMLQQTQVETVRPYFQRFTRELPDVEALAAAEEATVLKLWEGLGYYRRARSLHAAAKQVVAEHGGAIPCDLGALQSLPGVGRYTAGAIVSIAFGKPAPILEANTIRLFTRLLAYDGDPTRAAGQRRLWGFAKEILPSKDMGRFNQALMELGSLVCTPEAPSCGECPVHTLCEGNLQGSIARLGPTTKKLRFTETREAAVVVRKGSQVLVRQCPAGERWEGLWDFPRFEIDSEGKHSSKQELSEKVQRITGVRCQSGELLCTLRHTVTRFRITLDCYEATRTGGRLLKNTPMKWALASELAGMPMSVTARKIAKRLT